MVMMVVIMTTTTMIVAFSNCTPCKFSNPHVRVERMQYETHGQNSSSMSSEWTADRATYFDRVETVSVLWLFFYRLEVSAMTL